VIDDFDPRDAAVARLLAETPVVSDGQGLEQALAAYRNSRAFRGRRLPRHALRLGTVGVVTVLTGSLAAGYAAALPDPVQRVAHHLLSRVGVPAPSHHARQEPASGERPTPTTTASLEQRHPSGAHDVRSTALSGSAGSVVPTLATSWQRASDGRLRLRVHATGGSPADAVTVVVSPKHRAVTVLRSTLDRYRDAVFTFATPPPSGGTLLVRLPATARHKATHVVVRIPSSR
jgi:hypothetical protein